MTTPATYLATPDAAGMEPLAAVRASDGGFFFAGGGRSAWAGKTDAKGISLWNYFAEFRPWNGGFYPEFRGAAAMPDGTAYFCGFMPQPPGGYSPGLLTHLDAGGHLINERSILPSVRDSHGIASFDDCVPRGDSVIALGHIIDIPLKFTADGTSITKRYYWLTLFDSAGNAVWELKYPSMTNLVEFGPLIFLEDAGIVFAATDNINTEITHVDIHGHLISQKVIQGRFKLIRDLRDTVSLQMLGNPNHNDFRNFALISFDNNLNETERVVGNTSVGFIPYVVYKLPDQKLALFGSTLHNTGERYTSSALSFNSTLTPMQAYEFPYNHSPSFDVGFVKAACPTDVVGTFLAAREFRPIVEGGAEPQNLPAGFQRGVALDFVPLQ